MFFPEDVNKTLLAERASVGYAIVHRTDICLYDEIPPKLHEYLQENEPELLIHIDGTSRYDYKQFKRYMLSLRKAELATASHFWLFGDLAFRYVDFTEWREAVAASSMEFCRIFYINPTILQNYESGSTKNLPVVIRQRLKYFGMSDKQIEFLSEAPVNGWYK